MILTCSFTFILWFRCIILYNIKDGFLFIVDNELWWHAILALSYCILIFFVIVSRLDQGLTEVYSCPTCRRPLFPSGTQDRTSSATGELASVGQVAEQLNLGLNPQRISGHAPPFGAFPNLQQNPSDTLWRLSWTLFLYLPWNSN